MLDYNLMLQKWLDLHNYYTNISYVNNKNNF